MKKLLVVLLSGIMVLSLVSCDLDSILSTVEGGTEQQEQQEKQNTGNNDETIGEDNPDGGTKDNELDNSELSQNDSLEKTHATDDKNEDGGKWPDNEFTRLVPAPIIDVTVLAQDTIGELFTLQVEWTLEQGTEYAQQLADAGFGDDCAEKFAKYGYIDRTANGVNVQLLEIGGKVDISIMPVE